MTAGKQTSFVFISTLTAVRTARQAKETCLARIALGPLDIRFTGAKTGRVALLSNRTEATTLARYTKNGE